MDLGDAGTASKGLGALLTGLAALRDSLRRRNRDDTLTRAEALQIVELVADHIDLTAKMFDRTIDMSERVLEKAERAERTALVLADILDRSGDLTKKQTRRLEKARKPVRYNTRSETN